LVKVSKQVKSTQTEAAHTWKHLVCQTLEVVGFPAPLTPSSAKHSPIPSKWEIIDGLKFWEGT
jgi:hypothetical protein